MKVSLLALYPFLLAFLSSDNIFGSWLPFRGSTGNEISRPLFSAIFSLFFIFWCFSRLLFMRLTGKDISGHYFCIYFPFFSPLTLP